MAFTKSKHPIWYIDDTYANVAQALLDEKIDKDDILFAIDSETSGQVVVFVKKASSRYV